MIVAFTSSVHGQCANSTNCALMASLISKEQKERSILLQAGQNINSPDFIFGSNRSGLYDDRRIMLGIEAALMGVRSDIADRSFIDSCSMEIPEFNLNVLTGPDTDNIEIGSEFFEREFIRLLKILRDCYGTVFVDVGVVSGKNGRLAEKIIQMADVEVVSLCQNLRVLEAYDNRRKEKKENDCCGEGGNAWKSFFLFGLYNEERKWNIRNIRRRFGYISGGNSAVIPYNALMADYICEKGLTSFLECFRSENEKNPEFDFWETVDSAACSIRKMLLKRRNAIED